MCFDEISTQLHGGALRFKFPVRNPLDSARRAPDVRQCIRNGTTQNRKIRQGNGVLRFEVLERRFKAWNKNRWENDSSYRYVIYIYIHIL